ncbi:vacuolar protein sorting-associated protein [Pseudozyma hubeiensis SY62]|uniref:Vacuolar protein sorting-associated protein n=1 Tax=Pseudozyma hubeiensis (strain SY62) TaxID=1305764 RepID=R9P554_PSEHS|nr:vacuolar protein sorting-associated protein [Pseudozyma hubeiensis SY62]GAC96337.1 vacuolar protein sorting-associated protein [Pseudozyma hubeiensis SY62]
MSSSSSRSQLDQGISASRAGGAQKRPPSTSKAQTPTKKQRANPRPSPSVGSTSRRSGEDSATDSGSTASVRRRPRDSASAAVQEEPRWAYAERVLLDRTLRLHSVSPLHLSSLPASIQEVSRPLFQMLRNELRHYINLRLSDGFGFLESAGTTIDARDPESGDLRPPERRRRADIDRVGQVRIGLLEDGEFTGALQESNRSGEAKARPWAIEIELGKPAAEQEGNKAKITSLRSRAAQEATPAELCHIVFVPASTTRDEHSRTSRRYPLIATKAPSSSTASSDPLLATSVNVGPVVLGHALDWIQKRFDCRISSATGAAAIASQMRGPRLEALAELIVRQTRSEMGMTDGVERTQEQRAADAAVKPVELVFAFPTRVKSESGKSKMPSGPAPDLTSLTLTVPWEVCMNLLDGLALDESLLPALNHYLSTHTSIPLDALELTRIGVAGISVGAGRIKISKVPGKDAVNVAKRSLLKRSQGGARGQDEDEGEPSDRRRAGAVFAFLRSLAEGGDADQ